MKTKLVLNNLGYNDGLKIWQDKSMFNYSVDTILLGNFLTINHKTTRMLEIGANNAALSIFVAHRDPKIKIDAVEIQRKATILAQENVNLNKKEQQIRIICQDFNTFWKQQNKQVARKYQLIFANPPYYKQDTKIIKKVSSELKRAIYEIDLNLEQLVFGSSKIIEQKGRLALVLPIERFVDIIEVLRKYNFEPKKIQFVAPRIAQAIKFVLIESQFNAPWGTHYLPTLYLHPKNKNKHTYRKEVQKLYVSKRKKNV
ncbi:DNA methylase [Mesomycoplasma conjunctivae]|nr:tRNA1(Val) (adenine(37)-N6)-methyltransferase [Mesomycoplasma conjunctivae]VEU66329.1 DNA methylase [Mesomycoplasma conjunctivae]